MEEERDTTHEEKCEFARQIGDKLRARGFEVHVGHPTTITSPPWPDACIVGPAVMPLTNEANSAVEAILAEWGVTTEKRNWEDTAGSA